MRYIRIFLRAVSYLPGTFIHELAHYLAAAVFARPTGFRITPRIEGDAVVFGSVSCEARRKVALFFVGVAPLVWWYVLYMWLVHMGVVCTGAGGVHIDCRLFLSKLKSHLVLVWLIAQLLWAGKLSLDDLKAAVRGLFSFSGLAMIVSVAALYAFGGTVLDLLRSVMRHAG